MTRLVHVPTRKIEARHLSTLSVGALRVAALHLSVVGEASRVIKADHSVV